MDNSQQAVAEEITTFVNGMWERGIAVSAFYRLDGDDDLKGSLVLPDKLDKSIALAGRITKALETLYVGLNVVTPLAPPKEPF